MCFWETSLFIITPSSCLSIAVSLCPSPHTSLSPSPHMSLSPPPPPQGQHGDFRRPPGLAASVLRGLLAPRAASDWCAPDPGEQLQPARQRCPSPPALQDAGCPQRQRGNVHMQLWVIRPSLEKQLLSHALPNTGTRSEGGSTCLECVLFSVFSLNMKCQIRHFERVVSSVSHRMTSYLWQQLPAPMLRLVRVDYCDWPVTMNAACSTAQPDSWTDRPGVTLTSACLLRAAFPWQEIAAKAETTSFLQVLPVYRRQ